MPLTEIAPEVRRSAPPVAPTELMGAAITKAPAAPRRRGRVLIASVVALAVAAAGVAVLAISGVPSSSQNVPLARPALTKVLPLPFTVDLAQPQEPAPPPASASTPAELPDAGPMAAPTRRPVTKPKPAPPPAPTRTRDSIF